VESGNGCLCKLEALNPGLSSLQMCLQKVILQALEDRWQMPEDSKIKELTDI